MEKERQQHEEMTLNKEFFEWTEAVVWALALVIFTFTVIIHTNTVEGHSMLPTLEDGDRLWISNWFYEPRVGDVVIINKPSFREYPVVKRVIAVQGQEIEIDYDLGEVYVDGKLLDEPYVNTPTTRFYDMPSRMVVPDNCIFVMGDNRNESDDSRDSALGMVDTRYVLGKAVFRYLPIKRFGVIR